MPAKYELQLNTKGIAAGCATNEDIAAAFENWARAIRALEKLGIKPTAPVKKGQTSFETDDAEVAKKFGFEIRVQTPQITVGNWRAFEQHNERKIRWTSQLIEHRVTRFVPCPKKPHARHERSLVQGMDFMVIRELGVSCDCKTKCWRAAKIDRRTVFKPLKVLEAL